MVAGLLWAVLALQQGASAAEAWRVDQAPVRFTVDLTTTPSHSSAGYFVRIPDGGVLPGPAPDPRVFDEGGTPLKSAILWQNKNSGLGLVFEPPQAGKSVTVYVAGGATLRVWTPETGLTPSPILCIRPGPCKREDAIQLGQLGVVGPLVQFRNEAGVTGHWKRDTLTLAMREDGVGRHPGGALYMLVHVDVTDPGNIWVSPISLSGKMEVAFDGEAVHVVKKNEKRGGEGANVNLKAGLHRLDVYGHNPNGGATGPMMFAWRTPRTSAAELGGIRPADLKYPGTPMFEVRQLTQREIVKSGRAEVREVQSRDGGPVAVISYEPDYVYWFASEDSVLRYDFRALTAVQPTNTQYSWAFANNPGALANGQSLAWLLPGLSDQWVTLTATAGDRKSSSLVPLYAFSDKKGSLENPRLRAGFREACLTMLKSYPPNVDPVERWDDAMWNNLFRSLELLKEDPLVEHIVTERWEAFRKRLPAERMELLEDLFFLETGYRDPKRAIARAEEIAKKTTNQTRAALMRLKQAEIMMYVQKDFDGARKVMMPLLTGEESAADWAKIRMGDWEFLKTNLNEATRWYGEAQSHSKHAKAGAEPAAASGRSPGLAGPVLVAEKRRAEEKAARKGKEPERGKAMEPPPNVADWKVGAIRDVAASEEVANLMEQGFYLEAFRALRRWEHEFPLSKLTSDYILQEAKLYIWLGDYGRARMVLTAYCDQVDASNFLPEALDMVLKCMIYMKEPEAEIQKYETLINKRLEVR
jgi:hypothetical protein